MPELRRDPITQRWSIIATERAARPKDFLMTKEPLPRPKVCPFCPGNESSTPTEILALRPRGGGPWSIRVVPNKYPALRIEGQLDRQPEGIYDHMNGVGAHEVIIESPDHDFRLHKLSRAHLVDVLKVYRARMIDLQGDKRFRFSLLFRNHGALAGASIQHGHAQLIALPVVPAQVRELLDGAKRYYEFRERNVFDDIIRQEVQDGRRLIFDNGDFVLIAPYASRFPFETWILPRAHGTRFEEATEGQIEKLAEVLALVLDRLDRGLDDPPYNFILQSAPYGSEAMPWYRWHMVVNPVLTRVAGFEWGTGFYINPTSPEEAADFLRSVPG